MSDGHSLTRRHFLRAAAVTSAATLVDKAEAVAHAQQSAVPATGTAPTPSRELDPSGSVDVLTTDRPGADFMVDVIKTLKFDYVAANPGSSFRGLHESLINYGSNQAPEFITCCHEESSVALAHGYFKIEGRPMAVLCHGTVGLQHATMAIYNAYCDRVPVYLLAGNTLDATMRRPGVEWAHSVQDAASLVRDFTKWDDLPMSLPHFAESAVRAYKVAMTPPMMPVLLVVDGGLQEDPMSDETKARLAVPRLTVPSPPQGDSGAVEEIARLLVNADNPIIVADRAARTAAGVKHLVELAETLQAFVVDQGGRMNFPSRHPLRQGAIPADADAILGLELTDFWGTVNAFRDSLVRSSRPRVAAGTTLMSIGVGDLFIKANYQDFQRYAPVDLALAADAEATLPALVEAVKRQLTADRRRVISDRGRKAAAARAQAFERARTDATYAWDASPISTARLSAEIWGQIKNENWSLVSEVGSVSGWPMRLWDFTELPPVHRRVRWCWRWLWRAGRRGRGVGEQEIRKAVGRDPERRRLHVRARCVVDRRAPSDSAARRHAQQPRLPSGVDAPATDGRPAQPRHHAGIDRHDDRATRYRLREDRAGHGRLRRRPHQQPVRSRTGHRARRSGRQAWRTGSDRRRDRASVTKMRTRTLVASCAVVAGLAVLIGQPSVVNGAPIQSTTTATPQPAGPSAAAGDTQKGRELFASDGCYECHGRQGQGASTGPRLAPRPLAFAAFSRYVRRPTGQMPPYTTKVVSDSDLADIYAFLQSRPQPPSVASIPLLK